MRPEVVRNAVRAIRDQPAPRYADACYLLYDWLVQLSLRTADYNVAMELVSQEADELLDLWRWHILPSPDGTPGDAPPDPEGKPT